MDDRIGSASNGGGSSVMSVLAGAAIGAAGLAWWLLAEAERRRQLAGHPRPLRIVSPFRAAERAAGSSADRDLHDRVHELNQAIDDVRRQLETMSTQG